MNKSQTKNRGITLMVLVVTILIMLILVGVTLNAIIGKNGIIGKAKEAKKQTEIAAIKENLSMELLLLQMETEGEAPSESEIEEIVSKYGTLEEDKETITTKEGYKISLTEIYSGTSTPGESGDELKAKISMLEGRINTLEDEKAKLENLLNLSNLSNDQKQSKINDLNKKIDTLEGEKATLLNQVQNLTNNIATQEESINELNQQLANKTVEITSLDGQVKKLTDNISTLEAEKTRKGYTNNGINKASDRFNARQRKFTNSSGTT